VGEKVLEGKRPTIKRKGGGVGRFLGESGEGESGASALEARVNKGRKQRLWGVKKKKAHRIAKGKARCKAIKQGGGKGHQ